MKENNDNKIKYGIFIALIVILLIIGVTMFVFIVKKEKSMIKNLANNNDNNSSNVAIENTVPQTPIPTVTSNQDFSTTFLKLENNKTNMVYSPLSIRYALQMLKEGANGNTKAEIENLLGEQKLTKYNKIDKILSLANCIYIKNEFANSVKQGYRKILTEKYNAEINYDSFNNATNINKWIENQTLGIIKNMLEDNAVRNSEMLLINALAIDMEWEQSFDTTATRESVFYLEDGSKMNATTMHLKTSNDSVSYYKDTNITSVAMNLKKYNDTQLEFVAIMPEGNLSNYIEKFTIDEFKNIRKKMETASKTQNGLEISIPRFSFDYNLKLKDNLKKLGIEDAFNSSLADFSNISNRNLYVSDALHKANIDFTEKGIKAAAVTVIMIKEAALMEKDIPIQINIIKPFLYVIKDKNTDEIWFLGTVYEPNSWEKDEASYQYR